jgi:excinuclease UvrABC nuclease subunit
MYNSWPRTDYVFRKGDKNRDLKMEPGIYRLYDRKGCLLYIGVASQMRRRIRSHFNGTSNTGRFSEEIQYALISYDYSCDFGKSEELVNYEKMLIKNLNPTHNKEILH